MQPIRSLIVKSFLAWSVCAFVVLVGLMTAGAGAAEWGTVKGRFVFVGKAPAPQKINVTKDVEVCSKHHPIDESFLVDEQGGVANVLVYLRTKSGQKVPVHPDYDQDADGQVLLDNLHCRFEPHVALLRTSQTLVLKNSDSVSHNTKADFFANNSFNVLIPPGNSAPMPKLASGERYASPVGCNIHPWMRAFVLVREDPYMACSKPDGTFVIKNLPVGEHEFQLWQERVGNLRDVEVAGRSTKNGRITLTVAAGETDWGNIQIPALLLEGK